MPTPETRKRLVRVGPGRGLSLINRTGRNYPETGGQVPQAELDGLWWLYYNLDGDQWNEQWSGNDPSAWYGVTVDGGHVTDIDISGLANQLNGDITGFNPAAFPALRYFYVEGSGVTGDISGWRFPSTLQYLSLSNTNVTGDLSDWTVFPTISFDMTATGISGDLDQWTPGATFRTFDIINCDSGITSLPDFSDAVNVRTISIYGCGLSASVLDTLAQQLYDNRATYLYATQALNYGATTVYTQNESPSGVYQDDATPTTGMELLYKIEKDPDAEGINKWTITHKKYYVRGTVTGEEVEGVLVSATGDNTGNDTTDANGDYEILLETGVYTITPTLAGYTFDPVSSSVTVSGADDNDNDFVSAFLYTVWNAEGQTIGQQLNNVTSATGDAIRAVDYGTLPVMTPANFANCWWGETPASTTAVEVRCDLGAGNGVVPADDETVKFECVFCPGDSTTGFSIYLDDLTASMQERVRFNIDGVNIQFLTYHTGSGSSLYSVAHGVTWGATPSWMVFQGTINFDTNVVTARLFELDAAPQDSGIKTSGGLTLTCDQNTELKVLHSTFYSTNANIDQGISQIWFTYKGKAFPGGAVVPSNFSI